MQNNGNFTSFEELLNSLNISEEDKEYTYTPKEDDLILFSDKTLEQDLYYICGNYGYENNKGEVIIKPQYIVAGEFYNGFAVVATKYHYKKNGHIEIDEYNFVNNKGEYLCKSGFLYALPFNNYGLAYVQLKQDQTALINRAGEIIDNSYAKSYKIETALKAELPEMLYEQYFEFLDENDQKGIYDTKTLERITAPERVEHLLEKISSKFKTYINK